MGKSILTISKQWEGKNHTHAHTHKPKKIYFHHDSKLAWVPSHFFKIKLRKTKEERRKYELQELPK